MLKYKDLIGIPFVDGGRDSRGYDCWGLVMELFRRQGKKVKDYHIAAVDVDTIAKTAFADESKWIRYDEPQEGRLVLLKLSPGCWANHVGMCLGNGKFIHAYLLTGVCIDRLAKWRSRVVGYYEPREDAYDTNP